MFKKTFLILLSIVVFAHCGPPIGRGSRRIHIPFLGLGPTCTGCPPHFCDDDPSIVHGYCCGCARFYDSLPVRCAAFLNCPMNGQQLCDDYEYMMHCCCS